MQVPPIFSISGLPPPIPIQTFRMDIGSNPNLSRQSQHLYICSITSNVNEQNLTDFFNSKMIKMSIDTGGPGNLSSQFSATMRNIMCLSRLVITLMWLYPVALTSIEDL